MKFTKNLLRLALIFGFISFLKKDDAILMAKERCDYKSFARW